MKWGSTVQKRYTEPCELTENITFACYLGKERLDLIPSRNSNRTQGTPPETQNPLDNYIRSEKISVTALLISNNIESTSRISKD